MPDHYISKAVAKLHIEGPGQKRNEKEIRLDLKEINAMLSGGQPSIGLMFHARNKEYSAERVPGYISVPWNYTVKELKAFVEENASVCRQNGRKFIESEKLKVKINAALVKNRAAKEMNK